MTEGVTPREPVTNIINDPDHRADALETKEIRTISKLGCLMLGEGHKPVALTDMHGVQLRRIYAIDDRIFVAGRFSLADGDTCN
jgi:hypothetical protein